MEERMKIMIDHCYQDCFFTHIMKRCSRRFSGRNMGLALVMFIPSYSL